MIFWNIFLIAGVIALNIEIYYWFKNYEKEMKLYGQD